MMSAFLGRRHPFLTCWHNSELRREGASLVVARTIERLAYTSTGPEGFPDMGCLRASGQRHRLEWTMYHIGPFVDGRCRAHECPSGNMRIWRVNAWVCEQPQRDRVVCLSQALSLSDPVPGGNVRRNMYQHRCQLHNVTLYHAISEAVACAWQC